MRYFSDYGMFTYLEEAERMWINCNSPRELESHLLFELIGTLLGIAIYNGIILDLHFPPVIYKKLQGCRTDLADLKDVEPSLARSLQSLLQYDGDVESTFCSTFQVLYDGTFSKLCNLSRNLSRNLVLRHKLHAEWTIPQLTKILNSTSLDKNFITARKSITKLVIFQSFVAKCCKMRII